MIMRRLFQFVLFSYVIGMTWAIIGCSTPVQPDHNTQVVISQYPNAAELHQDKNYLEFIDGNEYVAGIVVDRQFKELQRRPMKNRLDAAEVGQIADATTTLIGLAEGFTEANPLGVAVLPAKYLINDVVENDPECRTFKPWLSGFGWGAAASNALVISSVAAGPAIAVGLVTGVVAYYALPGDSDCLWMGAPVLYRPMPDGRPQWRCDDEVVYRHQSATRRCRPAGAERLVAVENDLGQPAAARQ